MSDCLCDHCAALCCQYFALEIDKPTTVEEYDNIRWYLVHQNVVVFIENKKWFLGVLNKCKNLMDDNRCAIYEERPRICRGYSTDNCDYHGGDYGYEKLWTSADDFRTYAEEQLGRSILPRKKKKPRIRLKGKLGRRHVELPVVS